ncbi:MAG: amidohydrolase [Proteobacteria bacterium]|nr:MAG: amidohydrolase [Pseudomonadota bacterium]
MATATRFAEDDERARILAAVDDDAAEAQALARWMAEHPELALAEHEASARFRAWLAARGFRVVAPAGGMDTAFVAEHGATGAPFVAALLAEMDALPGIGHACGHNLSGPASLLAASALARVAPTELLRVRVVGCPAEEIGVGKRRLVAAGAFDGADVALMAHAGGMRRAHRLFLGNRKLELVYRGRAAHAAAYPERGVNALDGVIALFVAIGLLRQQLPRGVRVHGIVSDGGKAPNVIPERAAARVWIRAIDDAEMRDAGERVLACAHGAAAATGTTLDVREEEGTSPPLLPNLALASAYRRQLEALGLAEFGPGPEEAIGSSDITHVSRVVPTIHPNFPIGEGLEIHSRAFGEAAASERGLAGLLEAARALALTVRDLARDPAERAAIAAEFASRARSS